MFQQLSDRFHDVLDKIKGRGKLTEENISETLRQVRLNLLEADVNFHVVKEFCDGLQKRAVGEQVSKSLTPDKQFLKILHQELVQLMGETQELSLAHKSPVVVMMVGLQGAGKTTTAGKLARYFKKEKKRFPYLVPADVYRPAAIEQLKTLAGRLEIPCYDTQPKDNPVKLCKRAIKAAQDQGMDFVILDTAGRLQIDKDMMKELKKIKEKIEVHHVVLVVDAMTGQEAVNVAKAFNEELGISGVILTKLDGDARGGAALSVRFVTGRPIYFAGVGEKPEDLEVFHPDRVASRILGMGDIMGLIEKAEQEFDQEETKRSAERLMKNTFTLEDFRVQLTQMKKLGGMEKLLKMIPGMGAMGRQVDPEIMEKEFKKKQAIINSMTFQERSHPKLLNGRRRLRIAKGSGTQVSDINRLIKEFDQMKKMMKKFGKFGKKGLAGMIPGLGAR